MKAKTTVVCTACGRVEARWVGRCPGCGAWGSMAEAARGVSAAKLDARPLADVPTGEADRVRTGLSEFDRVLGGGLVPGSVTLVGGEPGAGKSTLLLQAAALLAAGRRVLYVSAEESPGQVRLRAERLDAVDAGVLLASEVDLEHVLALVETHDPQILVLDSIQTVRHSDASGAAGGVAQVRECAAVLVRAAKARDMSVLLVGHVTKDGQLAGPRVLEHLVDTVCELAGDRHHALRLLRASKNRFGPAGEVGCFEMTGRGLVAVEDPGRLFLGEAPEHSSGVAVTITLEGQRALACEVQALVDDSALAMPRRIASGLDAARLHLLLAVLDRRAQVHVARKDVYVSSVGGMRLSEPGTDLAVCLAVASAHVDVAVPRDVVALAEVGLAGELRLVAQTERRLAEAARLGFRRAIVPAGYDGASAGLHTLRSRDLGDALRVALPVPVLHLHERRSRPAVSAQAMSQLGE